MSSFLNNVVWYIPFLVTLVMCIAKMQTVAFLRVYLPCLMFVPLYWSHKIGALNLNVISLASVCLAIVGLATQFHSLRPRFVDLLVLLYVLSAVIPDLIHHPFTTTIYIFAQMVIDVVSPYVIGRTLIEQIGSREQLIKVLSVFLAIAACLGLFEFVSKLNLFQDAVQAIMGETVEWIRQERHGFARVAGPYGHAIFAGMLYTVGILLHLYIGRAEALVGLTPGERKKKILMNRLLMAGMILGLLIAQSRGPWMGCVMGAMVAWVGFSKDRKRTGKIMLSLALLYVVALGVSLLQYTSKGAAVGKSGQAEVDQRDAQYRREMIDVLVPIVEEGGVFGIGPPIRLGLHAWGYNRHFKSIDNEYLRIAVAQGYLGVTVFCSLVFLSGWSLVGKLRRFKDRSDQILVYCLLGALLGTAVTLTTVFLSYPVTQLLFLIFGWSESLLPSAVTRMLPGKETHQQSSHRLGKVYA